MNRLRFLLAILISFSLITANSNAAVKAGAKCTKTGLTSTFNGIKFTCIKSGNKLVWNKGIKVIAETKPVLNPVLKPAEPTPTSSSQEKNLLANDSRILAASNLTTLEICKTEDKTPDYFSGGVTVHKNGFPRPARSASGKKISKILVIPISFNDLPFRFEKIQRGQVFTSDLDILMEIIPSLRDSFQKLSAGRAELIVDVLPQSDWWLIDSSNPLSGVFGFDNFSIISGLITKYKSNFKFDDYDTFAFITGNGMPGQQGLGSAQANFGMNVGNAASGNINAILLAGGIQQTTLWVHELGHSLFAFEDLYLFSQVNSGLTTVPSSDSEVPMRWDLMADSGRGLKLLEWNRFLAGWLFDSEIRCLTDQKTSIHYLSEADDTKDPKLLTINLSPGVTLAAEVRATGSEKGLLLYTINTYINHGEGPIIAKKNLITKGQSSSMLGWKFTVLDGNDEGLLVEVIKTDIDKFVPPPPKPVQSNPNQPISPIKVTKGDIVPDGFLKARATWEVSGYESYRLYVTDVVDFQKVYFETGYVNDSRNPLVIDIKGLVCNKEFRTMTEFFTKKNGEGERLVIASLQLRDLSCEDTTKKP